MTVFLKERVSQHKMFGHRPVGGGLQSISKQNIKCVCAIQTIYRLPQDCDIMSSVPHMTNFFLLATKSKRLCQYCCYYD